jgi:hypothetical protein
MLPRRRVPLVLILTLALTPVVFAAAISQARPIATPPEQAAAAFFANTSYVFDLPSSVATADLADLLYEEGFEGTWPGPGWTLNPTTTTWGKRTCHPRTGQYAAWVIGGGSVGANQLCSATYPVNANITAVYGPFSLQGATSAVLRYHIYGKTEPPAANGCYDRFLVLSSTNGTDFSGSTMCGNFTNGSAGNGYIEQTLNLNSKVGSAQVWLLFGLLSDSTINDIGITVDDATLEVSYDPIVTYSVSGVVRNELGATIAGASITAFPSNVGDPFGSATTAADGSYTLELRAGTYDLMATKTGYTPGSIFDLVVPPGHTGVDMTIQSTGGTPTHTPTNTPTGTPTHTPTNTPPTGTPTNTPTNTPPTGTPTNTPTSTATVVAGGPVRISLPFISRSLPPTPTATPLPDPVRYQDAVITTVIGQLRITEIQRDRSFPPGCSGFNCTTANPGFTIVYLWVERTDGALIDPGALFGAASQANVTIVANNSGDADYLGTHSVNGRVALALANAEAATQLRFIWPGNPPVLLDR